MVTDSGKTYQTLTMITEDDLMQALIDAAQGIEVIGPGDVTIARLAQKSGRAKGMIDSMLRRMVDDGELVIVKKFDPQARRNVNVYVRRGNV